MPPEIPKDPFIGFFNIYFNSPRQAVKLGVRIVHWRMSTDATMMYLISDKGDIINYHNINYMDRLDD